MVFIKNSTRKTVKDCRLQLVLKTQFEATSRYEHVGDRKLVEQQLDSVALGRVKGRSEEVSESGPAPRARPRTSATCG